MSLCPLTATASGRTEFWSPLAAPRAHYSINFTYSPADEWLEVPKTNGPSAERSPGQHDVPLFDLPSDIKLDESSGSAIISSLNPYLWWGFGTPDDYEVRVRMPDGYEITTSGGGRYLAASTWHLIS